MFKRKNTVVVVMFQVLIVPCDVGNPENLQTLVDETVKKFGQIDVLVRSISDIRN